MRNKSKTYENYKGCLFNNKTIYRSQERFRSYYHNMHTEEVNKIALSGSDDKRLQTFDRITILMIMLMKIKLNIIKIGHIFKIIHTEY